MTSERRIVRTWIGVIFTVLFLLALLPVPADASETFEPIALKTIGSPSMADRLKENTANASFHHIQVKLGKLETERYSFTITETGWVGFKTVYGSDTDAAGGVRATSLRIYSDPDCTKRVNGTLGYSNALLPAGTYYIVVTFYGSYEYFGFFLPCSAVLKSAEMVVEDPSTTLYKPTGTAFVRVNVVPETACTVAYYLNEGEPDVPYTNKNFSFYTRTFTRVYEDNGMKSGKQSTTWNGTYYPIARELSNAWTTSTPVYIYVRFSGNSKDEWNNWFFLVPVKLAADLRSTSSGSAQTGNSTGSGQTGTTTQTGITSGQKITNGSFVYTLASGGGVCAAAVAGLSKTSVTIPSKVTLNGKSYKVTHIAASGFKGNTRLKTVTIPSSIKIIGKRAFYGCKNLKKITIKTTFLTSSRIGANAFKNIKSTCAVSVPAAKKKAYKTLLRKKGLPATATIK